MPLLRNADLLRPFLAVARKGNLSAAAREMSVSQPALTKSVRKLEQLAGVALFDRRARGMTLTPSGTALLAHARLIEAQCRFAAAEIEAIARGEVGAIRIGAGPYWGPTLVPLAVARLHERFPKLRVDLEVGVNTVVLPKLFAGDLDLVMSALPSASALPPGIEMEDFGEFHLRVLAGRHHPLQRKRRVTVADLARHPWVLYQHDQDTLDKLTQVLRAGGRGAPDVRVVTTSLHAVMQFLKSGLYLACLADAYMRAMPEPDVAIVPFGREIWSFPSGALYHASLRNFTPVAGLIDALRELFPDPRRQPRAARPRR
ncbi:MAG: LysR family transcriptional regulator [Betaproteobacteria bacterium]|nr:MAG: LysR family transcriptional regulator [Betaproteobacteria bacterium]